jgi:hypothetical protein
MPATALTAITTLKVIGCGEDDEAVLHVIKGAVWFVLIAQLTGELSYEL